MFIKKLPSLVCVALAMIACTHDIPQEHKLYLDKTPLIIDASEIIVKYDVPPTVKSKGIYYQFAKDLTDGVESWAQSRLALVGKNNIATLSFKEAEIKEIPNVEHMEKIEGKLKFNLSIPHTQLKNQMTTVEVSLSEKVMVDVPPVDEEVRKALRNKLITRLVNKLDSQVESVLKSLAIEKARQQQVESVR